MINSRQTNISARLFILILRHCFLFSSAAQSQSGTTLSGMVYFNGDTMPGMPVSLYSRDQVLQTEARQAGSSSPACRLGRTTFKLPLWGGEDSTSGDRLSGNLLTYPDAPLPSGLLPTVDIDLTAAGGSHRRVIQHVQEKGNFEFQNVPPGRYSMVIHHRGYLSVKSTVWIMRKDTTVTKIILYKNGHPAICE